MTQQITQHPLAESISALVDNQASELELQRILKASESDPEVKATWSRYQVVGAALRRDLPTIASRDFTARINAALAEEETYSAAPVVVSTKTSWWQNVSRFAVAASVAGGVVLFAQNYSGVAQDSGSSATLATAAVEAPAPTLTTSVPAGYHGQPLSARAVGLHSGYESRQQDNRQVAFVPRPTGNSQVNVQISNEEVRDYLNQLIEEHADNAALNSGQGMLPFARVVMTEED